MKWGIMGNIRFRGFFHHTLDDRKRLAIPSQFRQVIIHESQGRLVLTPGYDQEISIYAIKTWEDFEKQQILSLSMDHAQSRRYRRHFTFGIKEDELDAQGRILIPDFLLTHAGIVKDVMVIGEIDYFTLWSPEQFERIKRESETKYLEDAESIENLRRRHEGADR